MVATDDPCLCGTNGRPSCACPGPICCNKSSVGADFESVHGIFLTVRGPPSFARGGAQKEFCDVRGTHGSSRFGERRGLPGPCI
jgi:hypothetical protein